MIISAHSKSKVFHRPGCRYAEAIKDDNIICRNEKWARSRGYVREFLYHGKSQGYHNKSEGEYRN